MPYIRNRSSVLSVPYIKLFIRMSSSFCSIAPCLFESILMPKWLMQECYKMLGADSYQIMSICHFCYIYCVLHMSMSSTCVLGYVMPSLQGCMPCIFVINVVTSTSMQSSSRDVADFMDLEFHQVISLLLFQCHVFMLLQSDPCFFWVCSVRMILTYGYALSIHVPVCIYGVP